MKIRITTEQYNTILLREQQERSNKSQLNENVLMGFSKLIGVPLTKQNKIDGDAALSNPKTIEQIKDILEDKSKLDAMIDSLKEKGMENPSAKLSEDPHKLIAKFNKLAAENKIKMLGVDAETNLKDLK
jgi:hypothetical protein